MYSEGLGQDVRVERAVRHETFETCMLILQPAQLPELRHAQVGVIAFPDLVRLPC